MTGCDDVLKFRVGVYHRRKEAPGDEGDRMEGETLWLVWERELREKKRKKARELRQGQRRRLHSDCLATTNGKS